MRLVIMALAALALCGCAGIKIGAGYDLGADRFFVNIERPLEPGLKK